MRSGFACAAIYVLTVATAAAAEFSEHDVSSPISAVDSPLQKNSELLSKFDLEDKDTDPIKADHKLFSVPSKAQLCDAALMVAEANNLPPSFFTKLIQQESGFRPNALSSAGALGIAQFMPQTASSRGLADPLEPIGALAASGKYLAELVRLFGNLGLAAAAYNAGPGRVQAWIANRSNLPAETRYYVHKITGRAAQYWVADQRRGSEMQFSSSEHCPETFEARVQTNRPDRASLNSFRSEAPVGATFREAIVRERTSFLKPSIAINRRRVGTAPNGRPIGSPGSGKGSPEDPW